MFATFVKTIMLFVASLLFLSGCQNSARYYDQQAYAVSANVVKVESEYNVWPMQYWHNNLVSMIYTVKDNKGRTFVVKSLGSPDEAEFAVGQCVSLWKTRNAENLFYPRLSAADQSCQALRHEPPQLSYYRYTLNNEARFNRELETWLDEPVSTLIQEWGKPKQTYHEGQSEVLRYHDSYSVDAPEVDLIYGYSKSATSQYHCDIKFYIDKSQTIVGYTWQGNHCY